MQLADLQIDMARALVNRGRPGCTDLLTGGGNPALRFGVHRRHYTTSLTRALVERFAATVWLAGSELVTPAALAFVHEHPPTRPCLAEYGDAFPAYLGMRENTAALPYLTQFATMDWHLGRLAIAVDSMPLASLAVYDPEQLANARLQLQPGTHYLPLDWPLDELMSFYLSGNAPEQYVLRDAAVWLELRGSRGELSLNRLTDDDFVFRRAIANGATLADAAERATRVDVHFRPDHAVGRMLDAGLVTAAALHSDERS